MILRSLLVLTLFAAVGCIHTPPEPSPLRDYRNTATELIEAIEATEMVPGMKYSASLDDLIRRLAFELVDIGQAVANRYLVHHPECRASLGQLVRIKEEVGILSLEQFQRSYLENIESTNWRQDCSRVRNMIVHPADVIVTLKQPIAKESFKKMRNEISQAYSYTNYIRL